jgi:hyperosmotically inducible protein
MKLRPTLHAVLAASVFGVASGCSVSRAPESAGYVDDSAITSTVKSRMVEDKGVNAAAIQVETLNGNVVLSGQARTPLEKSTAEIVAMKVRGVKTVQNNLAVQP